MMSSIITYNHNVALGRSNGGICAEGDAARWIARIFSKGLINTVASVILYGTRTLIVNKGNLREKRAMQDQKTGQRQPLLPQATVHKHGKVSQSHPVPLWPVLNCKNQNKVLNGADRPVF